MSDVSTAVGEGARACSGGVLALHLLANVGEHRRQPLGFEHVHHRVDQLPLLERADQLARAADRQHARAGRVDDRVVGPVRHHAAPAPGGREPGRPRVGEPPDAELALDGVHADERGLEGGGRAELAELVGRQGPRPIEGEPQHALVGRARFGERLGRGEQEPEARRPGLLGRQRGVVGDGQRLAEQVVRELSDRPAGQCSRT